MKKQPITYAVQPATWTALDPHGCLWALDIDDARRVAPLVGERATLWVAPHKGRPYALCHL